MRAMHMKWSAPLILYCGCCLSCCCYCCWLFVCQNIKISNEYVCNRSNTTHYCFSNGAQKRALVSKKNKIVHVTLMYTIAKQTKKINSVYKYFRASKRKKIKYLASFTRCTLISQTHFFVADEPSAKERFFYAVEYGFNVAMLPINRDWLLCRWVRVSDYKQWAEQASEWAHKVIDIHRNKRKQSVENVICLSIVISIEALCFSRSICAVHEHMFFFFILAVRKASRARASERVNEPTDRQTWERLRRGWNEIST